MKRHPAAMPPCPSAAKGNRGAHCLSAVIPDNDGNPVLLFCDRCGMTTRHAMALPAPLDDMPSDAIRQLARRRHG
jgi:hypothetical protein